MEFLLDTHTFLWFINGDEQLSTKARQNIEDPSAKKYISMASFWEIAIKLTIGKLEISLPFNELKQQVLENGFELLPLKFEHISGLIGLEFHHRDPFDRILIAQSLIDKLTIISRDSNFNNYKVKVIW